MEKEKFKELYFSMTNKDLASKLNISIPTLMKYAKQLGFRKGRGGSKYGNKPIIEFTD